MSQDQPTDECDDSRGGSCWACGYRVPAEGRYCGYCGQGQGAFLAWHYRPVWMVLLTLTVMGPLILPIVWRTPCLNRTAKWIATGAVVGLTGYFGWRIMSAVGELQHVLGIV